MLILKRISNCNRQESFDPFYTWSMFEGFFFVFSAFKENVIEGDGPKNQTQSKMDLYETTVNAVLVNWL